MLLGPNAAVFGQQAEAERLIRQHRYSAAIHTLMGARSDLDGHPDGVLTTLGVAHLQRGYLLRDLATLQAAIGAEYYALRQDSQRATPSPWTAFFVGRHRFALRQTQQALQAFQAAADNARLPTLYRNRARLWLAASHQRAGHTREATAAWAAVDADGQAVLVADRAYARWQLGQTEIPDCGPGRDVSLAALRCTLWAAIRKKEVTALQRLQNSLLEDDTPDQEVIVGGDYVLRFYDPATLDMLAAADFVMAMEAFRRVQGRTAHQDALLYAGISAYESGHYDTARSLLNETNHPLAVVYLGALDYVAGNREAAQQQWARAQAGPSEIVIAWAEVASRFASEHEAVRVTARKHRHAAMQSQRAARMLGRAYLRIGRSRDALRVLDAPYPSAYHNDLDRIEPGYLVTLAEAEFMAGRQYYPALRSHLASLVDVYPITEGVLYLAQAFTLPERQTSFNKRTGQ